MLKQKQWTVLRPSEDFRRRYPLVSLEMLTDTETKRLVIRSKSYSHDYAKPIVIEHILLPHAEETLAWRQAKRYYQKIIDYSLLEG